MIGDTVDGTFGAPFKLSILEKRRNVDCGNVYAVYFEGRTHVLYIGLQQVSGGERRKQYLEFTDGSTTENRRVGSKEYCNERTVIVPSDDESPKLGV